MTPSTRNKVAFVSSIILIAALWEIIACTVDNVLVFPTIEQVVVKSTELAVTGEFWQSLFYSFGRVLISFFISFVLGLVLGFATGVSEPLRAFLEFPFAIIRSTPVVALIMVMLFWFDSSILPVVSGVLMSLPVITDLVGRAVEATDPKLLQMGKVYNFTPWMTFRYIYFNQARPYIQKGAGTIFALSFKVIAAGEILSLPKHALGTMIQDNRQVFESSAVLSLTAALVLLSVVSSKLFFICYRGVTRLAAGSVLPQLGNPRSSTSFQTGSATAPAPDAGITVQNLTFAYDSGKEIFKDFSLTITSGKITTLLAPTGKGKTTLLNILAGLITDYTGKVTCPKASYIFQEPRFLPYTNVIDNVAIPLTTFTDKKTAYQTAGDYLNKVNMGDYIATPTDNLSGGQKQLVSIARAFAFNAPVILMDEATSSLDSNSKEQVWTTIQKLQAQTAGTIIAVTHDNNEAATHSDQVVRIKN